jgi:hypothetical protein
LSVSGSRRCVLAAALFVAALTSLWLAAEAAPATPGEVVWTDFSQRTPGTWDAYTALAVTNAGEACLAGVTAAAAEAPSDVLVRKYGPGGVVRWRRVWTWPGSSDDTAAALARDRQGGIIVAGSSGSCWLLLKYSGDGYLQWVRRGRAPFTHACFTAVAVDGSGNVYAAGDATPTGGGSQILLRKYSADGALRWQKAVRSSAGQATAAAVIVGDGDVYLTGQTATGPTTSSVSTVKYSVAGTRRWVRSYAATGAEALRATDMGYSSGPVIAGWGAVADGSPKGFVVHYDVAGTLAWVAGYAGAGVTGDRFAAVSASPRGACVTGSRLSGGVEQMITLRFDAAGALVWDRVRSGATQGLAVCRTAGGFCSSGGTAAATTGLVTAAGETVWEQSVAPSGFTEFRPVALAATGGDCLYAAGSAARTDGGTAAMLIRYRQ